MPSKYIKNENGEFVCPNCEETKKWGSTMLYHIRTKHDGKLPYECNICNKDFEQKSSLEIHKLRHHKHSTNSKKVDTYKCVFDNCDYSSNIKAE